MVARNPFKPTAGATPPLLIGRTAELAEFEESLDDGPGAPARLATVTGPRGVGKTVMLTAMARAAAERKWLTVSETATAGLVGRLTSTLLQALPDRDRVVADRASLREVMGLATRHLALQARGLLITIDEIHGAPRADLKDLAVAYQHLIAEEQEVALILAGLPAGVSALLNDSVLTFLRRATPFELTDVRLPAVRAAFLQTISSTGRQVTEDALDEITLATGGYPFMIQLVGYNVWRVTRTDIITLDDARRGIPAARMRLGQTVHATALADLSDIDRTFLLAMSHYDGPARMGDISRDLNVPTNYAAVYRSRLIAAGMIRPDSYGSVDFALPFLREYLREHAAHEQLRI